MRYLILLSLIFATACTAQTVRQPENTGPLQLLRNGNDLFIEGQTFEEDFDFTEILDANPVGDGVGQVKTGASITFKNCRFLGRVSAFAENKGGQLVKATFLSNVSFVDCEFREAVSFRGSTILGSANFSKSRFFASANFEEAAFQGHANFIDCLFYGEARFQNAFFHQKANFMNAQFDQTAHFQNAVFQGEAQFSVTQFQGYADFSLIHCGHNCHFNYSQFNDQCTFGDAYFARRADFLDASFHSASFSNAVFLGKTRMHPSGTSPEIDFENCYFLMENTLKNE